MSSKDNLALDLEQGVRRWDRARWISVFSSHNPTIREVTECLGLGLSASSSTTNRGIPKFDNPDYRKLSSEVTKLSKELPKERDALLDFAADPQSLDHELEDLLSTYGPAIWSKDADRSCLLKPEPNKKTYNKDLFYEVPEHKEILKIHLHRWIIIKACYYIRNMKLKRPSGANEYDTLADMDESMMSPHGTPHSLTPPGRGLSAGAELEVKPINGKKRKSEAFGSLSDGERHSATPAKRVYSTLPVNRGSKSPRKPLSNLLPGAHGSLENVPPLPTQKLSRSPSYGVESARIQLSTLSSNELNGTARQPAATSAPAAAGFSAVNGGLIVVHNGQPVKETMGDMTRAASREPQQASPPLHPQETRSYTSPYNTSPRAAPIRQVSDSRSAPPLRSAPTASSPPRAGSAAINIATSHILPSKSESPALQNVHHANIAPQPRIDSYPQQSLQAEGPPHQQSHPTHGQHPRQAHSRTPSQTHSQVYQQPPPRPRSRAGTPSGHVYGRSLAPHPSSRSNTPNAQAAPYPAPSAPNAQAVPVPALQSAPAYNMTLVPTQPAPSASSNNPQQRPHQAAPQAAPQYPPQHQQPHQAVLKSQPVDVAPRPLVAPPPVAAQVAVPMQELRMLQCEVTTLLLQYLFPKVTTPPSEHVVLQAIHTLWYHGEAIFRAELGVHYDLTSRILTAWMSERNAITALQHSLAAQPGIPIAPAGVIDRLLAMNDLRIMRLKWKNMSPVDGLSSEDFLIKAFCAMTMTEGSEFMFKEGLRRVERGVFEWLRIEDAKIVVQRR